MLLASFDFLCHSARCGRVLRRFLRHLGRVDKVLLSCLQVVGSRYVNRVAEPRADYVNRESLN